jgi:hypothetical protein
VLYSVPPSAPPPSAPNTRGEAEEQRAVRPIRPPVPQRHTALALAGAGVVALATLALVLVRWDAAVMQHDGWGAPTSLALTFVILGGVALWQAYVLWE